jgi:hypothetical protein
MKKAILEFSTVEAVDQIFAEIAVENQVKELVSKPKQAKKPAAPKAEKAVQAPVKAEDATGLLTEFIIKTINQSTLRAGIDANLENIENLQILFAAYTELYTKTMKYVKKADTAYENAFKVME